MKGMAKLLLLGVAFSQLAAADKAARKGGGSSQPVQAVRDAIAESGLKRQALHAAVLGFVHPVTGQALRFESPLPPDMAGLETRLEAL